MNNDLLVAVGVVGNILSVVGVVITNKYITDVDGYNYMVFLSFLHFVFTGLGTRVLLAMNIFSFQHAPMSGVAPVALVRVAKFLISLYLLMY
jgi:hypothetical protein